MSIVTQKRARKSFGAHVLAHNAQALIGLACDPECSEGSCQGNARSLHSFGRLHLFSCGQ